MTRRRFHSVLTMMLLLALLASNSCRREQQTEDGGDRPPGSVVVPVRIARVAEGPAVDLVTAFGHTEALRREKQYAPLAGRIISLRAFEGTPVKAGDVLAIIETKESETALRGAESMLAAAQTPEQKAEAERMIHLAQAARNAVPVRAKVNGYVATRNVSEGELVAESAELLTIVDLATIGFVAEIPLRELPRVAVGQKASVTFPAMPGMVFPGQVELMSPQADPQNQTVRARLRFIPRPGNGARSVLKADMNGTASVVTGMRNRALFVPRSALLRNDEENTFTLVVVTPDSIAIRLPVTVGAVTDSMAEVAGEGLKAGQAVIVAGHYALADSTRVIPTP